MKRPAVFFDRDNTLIVNSGYLGDVNNVFLVRGAADAIARVRELGFQIVTFSNQSGVARGLFSEQAVQDINQKMDQLLQRENANAIIDRHEYCPYHPEAAVDAYRLDSDLRKPKPGMIYQAADALNIDLSRSWVVGDAPRDIEAGKVAGCRAILVDDRTLPLSRSASETSRFEPDETVQSITEAIDMIEAAVAGGDDTAAHNMRIVPEISSTSSSVAAEAHPSPSVAATPSAPSKPQPVISRAEPVPMKTPSPEETPRVTPQPKPMDLSRLEALSQQILDQVKRRNDHPMDFSLGKMLAGVTQILAIAAAISCYFYKPASEPEMPMYIAIYLQVLTLTLLVMGRDR